MKLRRTFSKEFKKETVALVEQQGMTLSIESPKTGYFERLTMLAKAA